MSLFFLSVSGGQDHRSKRKGHKWSGNLGHQVKHLVLILQKEMTARTPKECRQVCGLRSRMFDFLHQGCWQKQKESKIEVTEARLIRPVTERTQEPPQQQRRQEGEVLDRDGRKRFRSTHVAAVWREERESMQRKRGRRG